MRLSADPPEELKQIDARRRPTLLEVACIGAVAIGPLIAIGLLMVLR